MESIISYGSLLVLAGAVVLVILVGRLVTNYRGIAVFTAAICAIALVFTTDYVLAKEANEQVLTCVVTGKYYSEMSKFDTVYTSNCGDLGVLDGVNWNAIPEKGAITVRLVDQKGILVADWSTDIKEVLNTP